MAPWGQGNSRNPSLIFNVDELILILGGDCTKREGKQSDNKKSSLFSFTKEEKKLGYEEATLKRSGEGREVRGEGIMGIDKKNEITKQCKSKEVTVAKF